MSIKIYTNKMKELRQQDELKCPQYFGRGLGLGLLRGWILIAKGLKKEKKKKKTSLILLMGLEIKIDTADFPSIDGLVS